MWNHCQFIGNLTKDPETRSTPSGQAVVNITVACTKKWRTKGGDKQERTEFIDCVAWGKLAEIIGKYCTKGLRVFVVGEHQKQTWDDRNTGEKRSKVVYNLSDLKMIGAKREDAPASNSQPGGGFAQFDGEESGGFGDPEEDDIPF